MTTPRSKAKAATITSTTHAFVVAIYVMMIVLGVLHALELASHEALTEIAGLELVRLWMILHITGGCAALVGVLIAAKQRLPVVALWAEAVGIWALAVAAVAYNISIIQEFGWAGVLTTQTLYWTIAVGAAARIVQIVRDQLRIRRALEARVYAEAPILADPDSID